MAEKVYPGLRPGPLAGGDPAAFFPFGTTGEDNLQIVSYALAAGLTVTLTGRVRQSDGTLTTFQHVHTTQHVYTSSSDVFPLSPGILVNISARANTTVTRIGNLFAIVQLVRGFSGAIEPLATLLQGPVTHDQSLSWPGSPIRHIAEYPALRRYEFVPNPALGAELEWIVPLGAVRRVNAVKMRLTASAAVANRQPFVQYFQGAIPAALERARVGHVFNVTAGQDVVTQFARGAFVYDAAAMGPSTRVQGLPTIELLAGDSLRVTATGLQAGDQIQDVVIDYEDEFAGTP